MYVVNKFYLDMERLQVGETAQKTWHFLDSIADTEWHLHGQNLYTRDNVLLALSLQCNQGQRNYFRS